MSGGVTGNHGGRPPKPTAMHLVDGTYKKHRHAKRTDVDAEVVLPPPPDNLDSQAKRIYNKLGKRLLGKGIMTEFDDGILALYAQARSGWAQISQLLKDTGDVKLWRGINEQGLLMEKYGSRLGLSPTDRARVRVETPKQKSTPMAELLSGNSS